MIRIVKANAKHIDAMYAIEKQAFLTPWSYDSLQEDVMNNRIGKYFVALHKAAVVGYVGAWYFLNEAHITTIAVKTDYRNQGIGRKMLLHLFRQLEQEGVEQITLEVRESNETAKHLYKSLGFEYSGRRSKYYADTQEDALILWKYLRNETGKEHEAI